MNCQTATKTRQSSPSKAPFKAGLLQRQCACGTHTIAGGQCSTCRKQAEQGETLAMPAMVQEVLGSAGQPLDSTTRALMETGLSQEFTQVRPSSVAPARSGDNFAIGDPNDVYEQEAERVADSLMHKKRQQTDSALSAEEHRSKFDLSQVRVHTDGRAGESARAVNALAYTVGQDIVFAAGQYQPAKEYGQRLLAHELTHVAQQRTGGFSQLPTMQRQAAAPAAAAAPPATGGLSDEMLEQIVRVLHEALSGLNTDEEAIYSSFAGRTQEQVDAIARVYQEEYDEDLLGKLRSELDDAEMKHLAIFSPTSAPGDAGSDEQRAAFADMVAAQLRKAMKGLGTDEESIYAALTGRTLDELRAIKDAYARLTKRDLAADIEDEMSGTELTRAQALLQQGMLMPEDEIYLAVKGLGTDEETLFRALESLEGDRAKIKDAIDRYAMKGYGDMLEDIRDDLSDIFGDDFSRAMELLHGETQSGTCSDKERKKALEALSIAVSMTQTAVAKADADIAANRLSDSVENALKHSFNPGEAAGVVTVDLLRQVRDVLDRARTEILMTSDVTCPVQDPTFCVAKPDCDRYTYGWTGIGVAGDTVRLCNAFFTCMTYANERGRGMVHEFVHHLGMHDRFYHHAPGFSTLTPVGDQSATDSLDNADSYAHFAKELF